MNNRNLLLIIGGFITGFVATRISGWLGFSFAVVVTTIVICCIIRCEFKK